MATRNEALLISNLSKKTDELKNHLVKYKEICGSQVARDKSSWHPKNRLLEALNNDLGGDKFASSVFKLINLANELVLHSDNVLHDINESDLRDMNRQIRLNAAQRADDWKNWGNRLARWILGVSAAIVLYSFMVEFSEDYSFIHIPVRDLIISK